MAAHGRCAACAYATWSTPRCRPLPSAPTSSAWRWWAESREGYRALFSWNELFNSSLGDGVLLAWHAPHAPLPERAGPFALTSLHVRATGPRYVQRLATVDLHKLW
jgi:hypothetical protein